VTPGPKLTKFQLSLIFAAVIILRECPYQVPHVFSSLPPPPAPPLLPPFTNNRCINLLSLPRIARAGFDPESKT